MCRISAKLNLVVSSSKTVQHIKKNQQSGIFADDEVLFHSRDVVDVLIGIHKEISTDAIADLTVAMTTAPDRMQ